MVRLRNPLRPTCRGNRALRCNGVGPLHTHDRHCTRTHPDWKRKTKSLWISNGVLHIKKPGPGSWSYLSAPTASLLVWSIQTILTGVASLVEGKALSTGSALELMSTVTKGMVHYFSNFPLVVTFKKYLGGLITNATLHLKVSLRGQCQERAHLP